MLKLDWNILFTIINLIIFAVLMKLVFFKPIMKVMNKRKEIIKKQMDEAKEMKSDALEMKQQYEKMMQSADHESGRIVAEAKNSAKEEYNRIIGQAESDAEQIKSNARKTAEAERDNLMRSVNKDIAVLAMEAAEKVLSSHAGSEADSSIYNEFLNESSEDDEAKGD